LTNLPKAQVRGMQVREKRSVESVLTEMEDIEWIPQEKKWAERLSRNMAVAAALLICIAAVRAADENPSAQAVFQTVQEQLSLDLDDSLGKLTFVSNMLPEASMVFWNGAADIEVMAPVSGDIAHVWSAAEPYIAMLSDDINVYCGADGEVMSVAHGDNEERIVRIRHEDGFESIYGNLAACYALVGDKVLAGDVLGQTAKGERVFYELRQEGRSIDPTYLMRPREVASD